MAASCKRPRYPLLCRPRSQAAWQGFAQVPRTETWNVVGILRGSDPEAGKDAILLTAHLDHLGIGPAKNGDRIYNGADDDASGTTAVIELARVFAGAARPARTLLFVLFGSEEIGGYGNRYFLDHPPVPLARIVANLEFEMIGRRDPALPRDGLWLTGFDRSNLGPELVRHGAGLVADPHPEQNFFQRSDNYSLARRGIIAQTVSSFGLHADYHQPSDEISRIDFPHMARAIASMVEPIEWLAQDPLEAQAAWNVSRQGDTMPRTDADIPALLSRGAFCFEAVQHAHRDSEFVLRHAAETRQQVIRRDAQRQFSANDSDRPIRPAP